MFLFVEEYCLLLNYNWIIKIIILFNIPDLE